MFTSWHVLVSLIKHFIMYLQEPERMLPIISFVEKATAVEKGKGRKTKPIVTMKEVGQAM